MRRFSTLIIPASSLLLVSASVSAAPLQPQISEPKNYQEFRFGVNEVRTNIDSVQCGGWADNSFATVTGQTVQGTVPIPEISPDLPGRNNIDPLGKATTGIGIRGEFEFPESAWGFSSACTVYDDTIIDEDLKRIGKKIVYDYNIGIDDDPNVRVEPGNGEITINPGDWCLRMDKATPKWCKKLYDTWQKMSVIATQQGARPDPQLLCPCAGTLNGCPEMQQKRFCFDAYEHPSEGGPYTFVCHGTSEEKQEVISIHTEPTDSPPQERTCRTTWYPVFYNKMVECTLSSVFDNFGNYIGEESVVSNWGFHAARASSYYRHYAQDYNVPAVSVKASQGGQISQEWKVRAECYEYYSEKDPKDTVTGMGEEQCELVISTPSETNPDSPEWDPAGSQAQKGEVKPFPNIVLEPPRDPRLVPDPWIADSDTNLTILDMKKLMEVQKNFSDPSDITLIAGTMIPARQTASKTVPKNARTDTFDDTAERNFAEYWEEQQRVLLKMIADPQTKLIMPARFLVGLSDDDPLYQYVRGVVSRSDGTVEITLKAGPEDLANVLTSFQRLFVAPIQEVRIPILAPIVSVDAIDALIFDWKQWQQLENRDAQARGRASFAGNADAIITKLGQYRTAAENVRLLRDALPNYLTKLFDPQQQIRAYFAQWFQTNATVLLQAIQHSTERRELHRIWKLIQQSMLQADECQLIWCSNHRYSPPVYSLLDEWWGEAQPGNARDPAYTPLPIGAGYVQPPDFVFDFSDVKFPREPLLIPTLWPVQVRLNMPVPPLIGAEPPPASSMPDLSALPGANIFDSFAVPTVDLPSPPVISVPPQTSLNGAKEKLREFRTIVDGTDTNEQLFQEQLLAQGYPLYTNPPTQRRDTMVGSYCRFQPSIVIPPDKNDEKGNPAKIIHVENDLKERVARLFSRWMPERQADNAGRVARLSVTGNGSGCHEDVLCSFLPPVKYLVDTFQWFMPTTTGMDFTGFAETIRSLTLPQSANQNPYTSPIQVLERVFPKLDIPTSIDLRPPL